MFNLFSKISLSALLTVVSLSVVNSMAAGECYDFCETSSCDLCEPSNRMYIGGFGGGIYSNSSKMTQQGTAFFTEDEGGPLAVIAEGHTKSTSAGFGGAQIGYEWSRPIGCSGWTLAPALELEAYWYSHTKKGHLINSTDIDRLPEHDFLDTFKLNTGVYLANLVFSVNNPCFSGLTPYVGVGVGVTRISIKNADSLQVAPVEAGVNHFNSKRHDSTWAFAAQAKAGLRINICQSIHLFGEYRYLFVDSSNYIFGSTVYPTHAPTSPWNVKINNIQSNAFAVGIQFDI